MPARIEDRHLEQLAGSQTRERADDVRLALLLTYITLGWMTIEGAASLLLRLGLEKSSSRSIRYRQYYRTLQRDRSIVAFANRGKRARG